ncbi:MAG: insulinase family protein [Clostridia bacterium]|nr:insulinase family protein [Clostridia bacterium]
MRTIKHYPSGLRVIVEEMTGFTSVAFHIYVGIGSTKEDETNQGISHIIEHMLFKGTEKRSAFQIAEDFKNIGCQSNAFTSKTDTCYYIRAISKYIESGVEILSDMFLNSTFDEKELRREKNVIIEELKMYKDDPESQCIELVDENFYKGSPYSSNIIGTKKSIKGVTREQILEYKNKHYTPQNIVLSFAGNITEKQALELVEKYFGTLIEGQNQVEKRQLINRVYPQKSVGKVKFKDNSQSEVCITYPCVDVYSKSKYAATLLNTIWGSSSMSSRLFQTIREKMGLVYRIYSSVCSSEYGGDITIGFSTSTKNVPIALKAIKKEINKLIKKGITAQELASAKVYINTSTLLRYENTAYISLSNARELTVFGDITSQEDYLELIDKVTVEEVNELINFIYNNDNFVIACVGKDTDINLLKEFS